MHSEHKIMGIYLFCLSVCLSNAGAVSKRMDISSHFWHSDGGVILFLSTSSPLQCSKGNPSTKALNTTGWENFAYVSLILGYGTK